MHRRTEHGFTLIELLVSISILTLLSTWGIATYRGEQQKQSLRRVGTEIVSLLRDASTRSVTGLDQSTWRVAFFADHYELQRDGQPHQTYALDGLQFAEVSAFEDGSGGRTNQVEFDQPSGRTDNTGTLELFRPAAPDWRFVITVSPLGRISAEEVHP